VPIVALTANVMASERERYLGAGMDECVMKPVDWGELFAALARHGGGAGEAGGASCRGEAEEAPPAPTPVPADEPARLTALLGYAILDTPPEEAFDRVVRLAAEIVGAPIVLLGLTDERRQWYKAGMGLEVSEASRELAFCAHAILSEEVMQVPDATKDPRFAGNPLVTGGPGIRFYAGAPLTTPDGHRLGTLCAIDTRPRGLDERQRRALRDLAALAVDQLELRRVAGEAGRAPRRTDVPGDPGTDDPSSAAPAPAPARAPRAGEAALLDRAMLDRLRATLPAEAFAGLVRRGIENAERACARLPALPAGSEEQVREAHSLKGTSGTFGLRRVSAVAGEIEAAAGDGGEVSGLVELLAAVVAETREELRGTGLVPDRI
jgi:hypothetical protein